MSGYFEIQRGMAQQWECDNMGHWNVRFYAARLSEGLGQLRFAIGLTPAVVAASGCNFRAGELLIRYQRELMAGDVFFLRAGILSVVDSSAEIVCDFINCVSNEIAASYEIRLDCILSEDRTPSAWPPEVKENLAGLCTQRLDTPRAPTTKTAPQASPTGYGEAFVGHRGTVQQWECGSDGLMDLQGYFGRLTDAVGHMRHVLGFDSELARQNNLGSVALEYHSVLLKDLRVGQVFTVKTGIYEVGGKTFRVGHRLYNDSLDELTGIFEIVGCFLDLGTRRAIEAPMAVLEKSRPHMIEWQAV